MGYMEVIRLKKKVKTKATKKKTKAKEAPAGTIKDFVKSLFEDNPEISTEDVIAEVSERWPESKFGKTHVSFYRTTFRKAGMKIPYRRTPKAAVKKVTKKAKKVTKKKRK